MSRRIVVLLFVLGTLTAPGGAGAQRASLRAESFWVGAGVGTTWLRVSCSICRSDRGTALSGYVALGGSAGRRVLIGAEATGRAKRDGAVRETVWGFGAVTYWYLNPRRRQLYWKVGAGVQLYRIDDGQDVLTASPVGVQFGIGWEHPLNRHLRLVPSATLNVASWGGPLKFNGASSVEDIALTTVQLGLGVTRR